ncbi:MAG: cysteine--tRNA ligase [Lachnospiraceae bacterium]|nr:cysteine--tRNA ligase [Lachnospiraceae bacterium]
MKIFNTLSQRKEEFTPLTPGIIKMYVCGPTVYNLIHIGNARPMIVFDTFRRFMEHKGYEVDFVSNFTDVDDKIINAANDKGIPSSELSENFIKECKKDMEAMNVRPATVHPKATEEIQGMVSMIDTLIKKGYAYDTKDGTVYYRTRKFKGYGKLSHKNIDDLESGHGRDLKVTGNEDKEDYLDFVLWKPKKEGEPAWESPWCAGRPGWHIECSVMAKRYLGDTIDIHAGGEDLIFPHHENEIAQSEAANEKPFARYWMHNGFLNIDHVKMSKSAGNFFTVRDIAEKFDLMVLRFFMLSGHYRSPLNFSAEMMEQAKAGLERIRGCVSNLAFLYGKAERDSMDSEEEEASKGLKAFEEKFDSVMEDDLNTADAITAIFDMVKFINNETKGKLPSKAALKAFKDSLTGLTNILGLRLDERSDYLDSEKAEIEALIERRQEARKNKDFAAADAIRSQLLERGIILEDTRAGVKWKRAE